MARIYDGKKIENKLFIVRVYPLVDYADRHYYDKEIDGDYYVNAESREEALDFFHNNVPVKVLDDFEITVMEG